MMMSTNHKDRATDTLRKLLAIERFSLANYLRYARPWTGQTWEEDRRLAAIDQIARDQQQDAERIAELLIQRDGYVPSGTFPLDFTALNDLALDYVAMRVLENEETMIREIEDAVSQAGGDAELQSVARDVLKAEQSHWRTLQSLLPTKRKETQRAQTAA